MASSGTFAPCVAWSPRPTSHPAPPPSATALLVIWPTGDPGQCQHASLRASHDGGATASSGWRLGCCPHLSACLPSLLGPPAQPCARQGCAHPIFWGSLCKGQKRQQQRRVENALPNVWRTLSKASGLGVRGGPWRRVPAPCQDGIWVHLYPQRHFLRTFYGHSFTWGKTEAGRFDGCCLPSTGAPGLLWPLGGAAGPRGTAPGWKGCSHWR